MKGHVLFEAFVEVEVEELDARDKDLLQAAYTEHFETFISNLRGRLRTVSLNVYLLARNP